MRVEDSLYRFHSYHLQRATTYFDKLLENTPPAGWQSGGGGDVHDSPIVLDEVKASDFEGLLWFFYESGYTWQGFVTAARNETWGSVLALAERFSMDEVAKVACYALHRMRVPLGDARQIALCMRYNLPTSWMDEHIRRVLSREDSLSAHESRQLGFDVAALFAYTRERCHHVQKIESRPCRSPLPCSQCNSQAVTCYKGLVHICSVDANHHYSCPPRPLRRHVVTEICKSLSALGVEQAERDCAKSPPNVRGPEQGDAWLKVEDTIFCLHSFHLVKASPVFATMFTLPVNVASLKQMYSSNSPITLEDDTKECLTNMLWFFYDAPYQWTERVAPEMINKWESILKFGRKYDMADVCRVAVTALNHHGALSPVRKISLCDVYGIGDDWSREAYRAVCQREGSLTVDEVNELGALLTVKIVQAREQRLESRISMGGWSSFFSRTSAS